jgi:Trk K+ transport system NAD-binding subunit
VAKRNVTNAETPKNETVTSATETDNATNENSSDENNTFTIVLNTNVKLNETRYVIGETIEVDESDYEALLKAGVIDADAR